MVFHVSRQNITQAIGTPLLNAFKMWNRGLPNAQLEHLYNFHKCLLPIILYVYLVYGHFKQLK